jgi:hypothetical protein
MFLVRNKDINKQEQGKRQNIYIVAKKHSFLGAVAVPGGDIARQDALDCASVKVCECFR